MIPSRRTLAIRQFVAIGLALLAALFVIGHCTGCLTPKQAGDVTQAGCQIVEAFEGGQVVDSICASAPELAQIATAALDARSAERADAGARMTLRCRQIPTTGTCATDAELRVAIAKVKASR